MLKINVNIVLTCINVIIEVFSLQRVTLKLFQMKVFQWYNESQLKITRMNEFFGKSFEI